MGFIAATNIRFEGKFILPAALDIVTTPSSSGCLKTSKTRLLNSGSSSKKRTPLCASEISPGFGLAPPPTRATSEIV